MVEGTSLDVNSVPSCFDNSCCSGRVFGLARQAATVGGGTCVGDFLLGARSADCLYLVAFCLWIAFPAGLNFGSIS
jgi:hypothetical protein